MKKVAIYGLGTVGSGVLQIIREKNIPVEVAAVFDRSYQKKADLLGNIEATDDLAKLIDRNDIDIHIELLGGTELPLYIARSAIDKGQNVITANKALLAEHGYTLFNLASRTGSRIGFEASIAGAIPIIRNLESVFQGQQIYTLEGILNGTTNYILTRMRREKKSYSEILSDAQKLGLAEADPYLDVSGMDATHKLAILTSLIADSWIDFRRIHTRGIESIDLADIENAERMGYRIRLLGRTLMANEKVTVVLEPVMIPPEHYLWDVEMENNAIALDAQYAGRQLFVGKGAGRFPTASSVISDLYALLDENRAIFAEKVWEYGVPEDSGSMNSRFYIRIPVVDRPGVLAALAQLLANHDISIASVHQEPGNQKNNVNLTIVTHECKRANFIDAVNGMRHLEEVTDAPVYLPLID
jgi:homoserine dehydrogenase